MNNPVLYTIIGIITWAPIVIGLVLILLLFIGT